MLERLAWVVVRWRRLVLTGTLIGCGIGVLMVSGLSEPLQFEAFVHPPSEAYQGRQILEDDFGVGVSNLVLLVTAKAGSVDDPKVVTEAQRLESRLASEPRVADVRSYWSAGRPANLRNAKGDRAVFLARILGNDQAVNEEIGELAQRYKSNGEVIDVGIGGSAHFIWEATEIGEDELNKAERVTGPLTLIALLAVFGSLVASLLPLAMAGLSVLGTAFVLRVMSEFTPVSSYALFFTTILGLGLAIDYSLLVINRFREELALDGDPAGAVRRTMGTAGRTVMFSAAVVVTANAAMLVFPLTSLRSFGYAGMATAAIAGISAVVVLPAILAVLGPNVNRGALRKVKKSAESGTGRWYRAALAVMRRPFLVAGAVMAVLLLAASPALNLEPGLIDERELPESAEGRRTGDVLRTEFGVREGTPLFVVATGMDLRGVDGALDAFARRIAALPGVTGIETATGSYSDASRISVSPEIGAQYVKGSASYLRVTVDTEPISPESESVIDAIRDLPSPFPRMFVTGEAANAYDIKEAVLASVPLAFGLIALTTAVMLLLQFGSILVPIKAILLNIVSLAAIFGGMVWIFQDGHLSHLLGFTATGFLYINLPIIIFCIAFGLSMDYEVFLLSRIKEEYDRTGDNDLSVALGLERSGRIVSASAVLIAVVFLTTGVLGATMFSKAFGLGLGSVVLLDAFVVRGTLVPALMKLAGRANWWAPKPLRSFHCRFGLSEVEPIIEQESERRPREGGQLPNTTRV